MPKDTKLYDILNVPQSAGDSEIRKVSKDIAHKHSFPLKKIYFERNRLKISNYFYRKIRSVIQDLKLDIKFLIFKYFIAVKSIRCYFRV